MKLSEIRGEQALDVLASILEPAQEIMMDQNVAAQFKEGGNKMRGIATAIKSHKKAVIEILAALDGADPKTYEVNVLTLPAKVLEIINDEEVLRLFQSPSQKKDVESSGSATGNTVALVK